MSVCRFCGKPLPLLQRLSGEQEFCTPGHRQRYQEEFNRLALSRLMPAARAVSAVAPAVAVQEPEVPAVAEPLSLAQSEPAPQLSLDPPEMRFRWLVTWDESLTSALHPDGFDTEVGGDPSTPDAELATAGPIEIKLKSLAPEAGRGNSLDDLVASGFEQIFIPQLDPRPLRPKLCFAPKAKETVRAQLSAPQEVTAPSFASVGGPFSFWAKLPVAAKAAAVALVLAAIAISGWRITGQAASASSAKAAVSESVARPIAMGPGGWFTKEATDKIGRKRSRTFSLYKPALELSDYRVEFSGRIERNSLGWVLRLKDPGNYYGMKLRRSGGKLKLMRWAMIDGEESAFDEIPVPPMSTVIETYDIRVDARGPRITTYLQGQQIDAWTDNTFAAGGFGFTNDAEERARIESVRFYLFTR